MGRMLGGLQRQRSADTPTPFLFVQVQAADSVLVIGGGSTGVEMAAEIKTEYPDKKVTTKVFECSSSKSKGTLHP